MNNYFDKYISNRGATLLISMVLMIMLSLLGVAAMNTSIQESRIARSFQESVRNLSLAEAGIERARQEVASSGDPNMPGWNCESAATSHFYPEGSTDVLYCIDVLNVVTDNSTQDNRGSGQNATQRKKTYIYKMDSFYRRNVGGTPIVVEHVTAIERMARTTD